MTSSTLPNLRSGATDRANRARHPICDCRSVRSRHNQRCQGAPERQIHGRLQRQIPGVGRQRALALGQFIYDLGTGAGLSQRELAARMGTTQSVISRLEEGDGCQESDRHACACRDGARSACRGVVPGEASGEAERRCPGGVTVGVFGRSLSSFCQRHEHIPAHLASYEPVN